LIVFIFCFSPLISFAQLDTTANDSSSVMVQAFLSDKKWKEVPAAVAVISHKQLNALSTNNLLPAFNTITGVKMEERSPGSYRLAIRGSSLRSPFGVRNVKVYYNSLPLTDGGGNTYLNLLALQQINNAEVLKGVAGSMYGAGTGGVVLLMNELQHTPQKENHFSLNMAGAVSGYGRKMQPINCLIKIIHTNCCNLIYKVTVTDSNRLYAKMLFNGTAVFM